MSIAPKQQGNLVQASLCDQLSLATSLYGQLALSSSTIESAYLSILRDEAQTMGEGR
jgi:hypothetical protein